MILDYSAFRSLLSGASNCDLEIVEWIIRNIFLEMRTRTQAKYVSSDASIGAPSFYNFLDSIDIDRSYLEPPSEFPDNYCLEEDF